MKTIQSPRFINGKFTKYSQYAPIIKNYNSMRPCQFPGGTFFSLGVSIVNR